MTTHALSILTHRRERIRLANLRWALLLGALTVGLGAGAGRAPLVVGAAAALVLAISAIAALPALALLVITLIRASLDTSGALISFAGTNLAGALGIAVMLGGAAALLLWRPEVPARGVRLALLALAVWAALSLAFTPALLEGISAVVRIVSLLVLFCLGAWTVKEPRHLRRAAWFGAASALVPVGVGLIQLATGSTQHRQGYSSIAGTFLYPNGFALYLLIVLALVIVLVFESTGVMRRGVLFGGLALVAPVFVITYARAEWIGLVVLLGVLACMQYRRLIPLAAIALVGGALAVPSSVGLVQKRFSDLSSASAHYDANSWSWRVENWSRMLHFATDRPAVGHGLSSYPPLTYQEFGTGTRGFSIKGPDSGVFAHNDYLMLAVELGLPGLLLWLAVLVGIARAMLRARVMPAVRPYASAMFAIMVAILLVSAADNVMTTTSAMYYVFALAGAVAGADAHARRLAAPG